MTGQNPEQKTEQSPQGVTLRPAAAQDLDALLALVRAYYAFDGIAFDDAKQRRALEGLMADPTRGEALLVERAGLVVGYAVMTLDYSIEFGGLEAFIDELFLRETVRGGGVGAQVVALIKGWCAERGLMSLNVVVEHDNAAALRFYLRNGWGKPHRYFLSQPLG